MRTKSILLFFLLSFFSLASIAQQKTINQKTAYEIQVNLLTNNMLKELGLNASQIKQYKTAGSVGGLFMLNNVMKQLNTERGILLLSKFNRDLEQAKKLKTLVDFKREKEKLEKIENEKQEKLANEEKIRLQEKYDRSDYVAITESIKAKLTDWLLKAEFEKTEDFINRIEKNTAREFDTIAIQSIHSSLRNEGYKIKCELLKYDADLEIYPILVKYNDIERIDSLKVSIKNAQQLKENFDNYKVVINNEDWVMFQYNWCPKKLLLVYDNTNDNNDENVIAKNARNEIKINLFKNGENSDYYIDKKILGIENSSLDNLHFSWNEYVERNIKIKEARDEKERMENEKIEKDRIVQERLEKERIEYERIIAVKAEKDRINKEESDRKIKKFEATDFGQIKKAVQSQYVKGMSQSDLDKIVETETSSSLEKMKNGLYHKTYSLDNSGNGRLTLFYSSTNIQTGTKARNDMFKIPFDGNILSLIRLHTNSYLLDGHSLYSFIPIEFKMINNYWKVSAAIFILNTDENYVNPNFFIYDDPNTTGANHNYMQTEKTFPNEEQTIEKDQNGKMYLVFNKRKKEIKDISEISKKKGLYAFDLKIDETNNSQSPKLLLEDMKEYPAGADL